MSGRRSMKAVTAMEVERVSGGRVMRWDLRPDWHRVWPELTVRADAPKVRR